MSQKLTAKEVADKLRVNVQTVYNWARTGRLPCQRIGLRPVLFDEDEIENWLRQASNRPGENLSAD